MRALYRYLPATALAQVIFNRGSDSQSNRHRGGTHGGMKFFTSEKSAVAHTFSLDWWCGRWAYLQRTQRFVCVRWCSVKRQ